MISRRDFIQTATVGGTLIGTMGLNALLSETASAVAASSASQKSEWIDAHVHVWTPDIKKYPLSDSYKVSDMAPPSFTPEELFAHCKPQGVTKVVLIQMIWAFNIAIDFFDFANEINWGDNSDNA